jgi:arylsulfatase A-like enzyme
MPGANLGLQPKDPTIAELKPRGHATGQFGKNHLGDRNEFLRKYGTREVDTTSLKL